MENIVANLNAASLSSVRWLTVGASFASIGFLSLFRRRPDQTSTNKTPSQPTGDLTLCDCDELQQLCTQLFLAHGAHPQVAQDCGEALIRASRRGIDSHGVALLPRILERVADQSGLKTQLSNQCTVELDSPAVGVIDARLSPGQHACLTAARMAAEKAAVCGVAMVLVKNSTHFGAAASFLETLLDKSLVGVIGSNCTPSMAILGSTVPNSGNSPWGFCAPVADGADFLFDYCCAVMSFGKLNRMKAGGEPIPADAFIAAENNNAGLTNQAAMKNIGLAFGGAKGACVAMMIEVLSGVLSNGHFGSDAETMGPGNKLQGPSHFVLAIDPSKFGCDSSVFASNMKKYLSDVKAPSSEIRYAGERAASKREHRSVDGIPLTDAVRAEIETLAKNKGIATPWKPN